MNKFHIQKWFVWSVFLIYIFFSFNVYAALEKCSGFSPAEEASKRSPKLNLSGKEKERYEYVQDRINTHKEYYFHTAVVEPDLYKTQYSLYILGIEKPRDKNTERPYCRNNDNSCVTPKFDSNKFEGSKDDVKDEIVKTREDIEKNIFEDKRPFVLTHILNVKKETTQNQESSNQDGCFIFNIYGHNSETAWCKNHQKADVDKIDWKREGWKGLDKLGADIQERAIKERATHIILLATGWNTRQYESYLDFLSWMNNLTEDFKKANKEFRPIFIGTAWESEWTRHISFVSEITKGNDADEIGYTWQNYLLNDLIKPVVKESGAQLVVIGHSFGSRIALGAHYARHVLDRKKPLVEIPLTIIGMQAAFPITRFITSEGKEHQYVAENKGNANVVITSSQHDEATGKMCIGTAFVGAGCGLNDLRDKEAYKGSVVTLNTRENGDLIELPDIQRVSVYDASSFVNCELPGTSSGAHSDVYDKEMGHFLGEIIRSNRSSQ